MAVGETDGEVDARRRIMQRMEALAVQPLGALAQHRIVLVPGRDRAILVDARRREDRFRQFRDRDVLGNIREKPALPRMRSDKR